MSKELVLHISPEWEEIEKVRLSSHHFLRSLGFSSETADAISMTACELTENAVKYGDFSTRREITVTLKTGGKLSLEVRSPIGADAPRQLRNLEESILWIRGYQNPMEAYVEKLKTVTAQPLEETEASGLGLTRTAYEGQSWLDFYVDEGRFLCVSAVYQR